MNRKEVVVTIERIYDTFCRVFAHLFTKDFAKGYRQALNDVARAFETAPLFEDFEDEREELHAIIKSNQSQIATLTKTIEKQERTINKLMPHVDIWSLVQTETKAESGR